MTLILVLLLFMSIVVISSDRCTKGCSGYGSLWNNTNSLCICGMSDQNMWGDNCQYGRVRLVNQSGQILDGTRNYNCQSKYMFLIDSKSDRPIKLSFNEFVTECNWDHLYIFDGTSSLAPLIAIFSGNLKKLNDSTIPTRTLTVPSGTAYLYFYSDQGSAFSGFNITYQISTCQYSACNEHGICNKHGQCICDSGWTGINCSIQECTHPFFNLQTNSLHCSQTDGNKNEREVLKRASHTAIIIESDSMMVFGGMAFDREKTELNLVQQYNLAEKKWTKKTYSQNHLSGSRYGHSIVSDGASLIIFGGTVYSNYQVPRITNDSFLFDTKLNSWNKIVTSGSIAVSGHAAVVVHGIMYAICGYNNKYIFTSVVQKLKLKTGGNVWDQWEVLKHKGHVFLGRSGHTASYDQKTNNIYVFGGFVSLHSDVTDEMIVFDIQEERWSVASSSNQPRMLHSSNIINRNLIVFGGNGHSRYASNNCFNKDVLLYSLDCDKWTIIGTDVLQGMQRYGHSAVVFNNSLFVFGGFDGTFLNDVIEIRLGGDCSVLKTESSCLTADPISGCVWEKVVKKCFKFEMNLPESSIKQPECQKIRTNCHVLRNCTSCTSYKTCAWDLNNNICTDITHSSGDTLRYTEECPDYLALQCTTSRSCQLCTSHQHCAWKTGGWCKFTPMKTQTNKNQTTCFVDANVTSCHDMTSCGDCLRNTDCLWCESTKECSHSTSYVVNFPYGQCYEWISNSHGKCEDIRCEHQHSCHSCLEFPNCGWCEDDSRTGLGNCMDGTLLSPHNATCSTQRWKFSECPSCHCNGHSTCFNNTDTCQYCHGNVIGKHCDKCKDGYYGLPENNGTCMNKCECNGHSSRCNSDGKCSCNLQGAIGDHCERCNEDHLGDPTNGGMCTYPLKVDFFYTSNLSVHTVYGYSFAIDGEKKLVFSLEKTSGADGYLNLTITYKNDLTTSVVSAQPFGSYKHLVDEDVYVRDDPVQLQVIVYGWQPYQYSSIKLSLTVVPSEFDIVRFLTMFIVCFISLLVVLLILWKIKQRYAVYIRNRRNQEEHVKRLNRPMDTYTVVLRDKSNSSESNTLIRPLGIQSFLQGNCGPVSYLAELPCGNDSHTPLGQSGLCIVTVLAHQHQKQSLTKIHAYYRKRPKAIPV